MFCTTTVSTSQERHGRHHLKGFAHVARTLYGFADCHAYVDFMDEVFKVTCISSKLSLVDKLRWNQTVTNDVLDARIIRQKQRYGSSIRVLNRCRHCPAHSFRVQSCRDLQRDFQEHLFVVAHQQARRQWSEASWETAEIVTKRLLEVDSAGTALTDDQRHLRDVARECSRLARELCDLLSDLKPHTTKHRDKLLKTWKSFHKKDKVLDLHNQLQRYQHQLDDAHLVDVWWVMSCYAALAHWFPSILKPLSLLPTRSSLVQSVLYLIIRMLIHFLISHGINESNKQVQQLSNQVGTIRLQNSQVLKSLDSRFQSLCFDIQVRSRAMVT